MEARQAEEAQDQVAIGSREALKRRGAPMPATQEVLDGRPMVEYPTTTRDKHATARAGRCEAAKAGSTRPVTGTTCSYGILGQGSPDLLRTS